MNELTYPEPVTFTYIELRVPFSRLAQVCRALRLRYPAKVCGMYWVIPLKCDEVTEAVGWLCDVGVTVRRVNKWAVEVVP